MYELRLWGQGQGQCYLILIITSNTSAHLELYSQIITLDDIALTPNSTVSYLWISCLPLI